MVHAPHHKQQQILDFIREYHEENGISPTVREIAHGTKITLSVVYHHLDHLVDRGIVKRNPNKARGMLLTELEEQTERKRIPLLGVIAAGEPIPSPEGPPEEYIDVSMELLSDRPLNLFALRVKGNSMLDALVHDGDYVIIRSQATANSGEMIAAWIHSKEETTLKYYRPEGSKVRLIPDNSEAHEIVVDANDLQIKGVVVFVYRSFPRKI